MTHLYTQTPQFFGDICEEVRLFIDTRKISRLETAMPDMKGFIVVHEFAEKDGKIASTAKLYENGEAAGAYTYRCASGKGELNSKRVQKRAAKISVYRALSAHFSAGMPWGSLTGIRPTKLLRDSVSRIGKAQAKSLFLDEFDVSRQKYDFTQRIVEAQAALLPKSGDDVDVYIGIPFCTTRCAYCSFASSTPDVFTGAEDRYIDALMSELDIAEELLDGRNVRALYIGGGTPTAVRPENLEKVLARAAKIGHGAAEFTVEAGRPDTITQQTLDMIWHSGARRISVNAQTLRDDTLERIGRCHSAADFFEAYRKAAGMGFDAINVDIIAGLPGEAEADVADTLRRIIDLEPENITVHTLAVKRASAFAKANMGAFPGSEETALMIENAQAMLAAQGYSAYYMYRQKYMKGSMENAGYALAGKACIYNIDNMEEVCDVMAFGAGAISKRIFDAQGRIERAANIKDLREYIARIEEMPERKRRLFGR